MTSLVIDPQSGIAGDMFIAALIDAGAPEDKILAAMNYSARLLGGASMRIVRTERKGVNGVQLELNYTPDEESIIVDTLFELLEEALEKNDIHEKYREYARRVLLILSEAEVRAHLVIDHEHMHEHGHAHGHDHASDAMPIESENHNHDHDHHDHDHRSAYLHEAQDILVDITGSALAMQALSIDLHTVSCLAPVFTGGGTITFSHGTFPVPAPAVKEIVQAFDIPVADGPVNRELLTPTGAAILAALGCRFVDRSVSGALVLDAPTRGVGFGTHIFDNSVFLKNGCIVYCK